MPKAIFARVALLVLVEAVLIGGVARGENWPYWRGPQNNGISDEKGLPAEFSKSKNLVWRLPLPGPGGASPVVWGDHIFVTAPDGEDLLLICVKTDGHEAWRRVLGHGNRNARGDEGNSCSPSPLTDGKYVWCFMGSGDLGCFDFSGKEIWKFNVQDRYGRFNISYGMSSTPVLDGDRLFLQLIHGDRDPKTHEATVVALDKHTGSQIWKQTRLSPAYGENEHSYASPMIYDDGKLKFLLTHGADFVVAHRLDNGEEIWRCGGLNPKNRYNPTLRLVASPAVVPGLIVVPSAKSGPVVALRPDGVGDVTDSKQYQLWKIPRYTPDVPSPVIHDHLVYLCRENGDLMCLDAHDGHELYRRRTRPGKYRSSPIFADGKIYVASRDGQITVVKAGEEFVPLATNELHEQISSSPAVSGGRIYLRTFDALWAVGLAK